MEQKTTKIYPSAHLMSSDKDLEERLENKSNDVNWFNISFNNIKEMIMYFK